VAPTPVPAPVETSMPAPTDLPFIEVGSGPTTGSSTVLPAEPASPPEARPTPPVQLVRVEPLPPLPAGIGGVTLHEVGGAESRPLASRLAPGLVAYHQPEHEIARQYRGLLEAILKGPDVPVPGQGKLFLFSSLSAAADSAEVVLNLALTQARRAGAALRSVVVDAGTAGGLHRLLGLPASPGLCEVISGAVPLTRAVRPSGVSFCHVLTAGETGKPCLAVRSLVATLGLLRKRFDLVYVDAPSWHGQPGLIELAACCDGVFLITPRDQAGDAASLLDTLPSLGVPLRGCITIS
jgi:Mrp family chromosome partitioning ATPase